MDFNGTLQDAVALIRSGNLYQTLEKWTREIDADSLQNRLVLMAEACRALGLERESVDLVEKALEVNPENVRCLCSAGEFFEGCQLLDRAFHCFFKASQLSPGEPAAWSGMGYVFLKTRKLGESMSCLQKSFELNPSNPDTSNRLGLVLLELKNHRDAIRWFLNSIRLKPDFALAWSNLAVASRASNQIQVAIRACKNAVKLEPASAANWMNLGVLYQELNHIEEALFAYRKAVSLDPDFHLAHVNEGIALLLKGDLQAGWAKYEHRWLTAEVQKHRHIQLPLWDGNTPLEGKSILLHSDQGFGDTIQCLRFAPVLTTLGATVHVEVNPALVELTRQVQGVASVVALREAGGSYDFQCPFLSLPFACKVSLKNLPNAVPYLQPSRQAAQKWSHAHAGSAKPKVGIVWRGNPEHDNDRNRSLSLASLNPLLAMENCEFVNLQWGLSGDEERTLAAHRGITNPMPRITSFDDTAALMQHLDLVVSVDTSVAHLAGALGRSLWLLLPFAPDWRWMLDRTDSPWYPTARIFRQPRPGDWAPVIQDVASRLKDL